MRQWIRRSGLVALVGLAVLGLSSASHADGPVNSDSASQEQTASQSVPFQDVPANHWAADHIAYLVDQGVIEGTPGGTFQGERSPNRYEVAAMLSRALQGIEDMAPSSGQVAQPQQSGDAQPIRQEDFKVLQDLIFKLSDRVQTLSGEVDTLKNERPEIDPQLGERIQQIESQASQVEDLKAQLQQQQQRISELEQKLSSFQQKTTTASEERMAELDQQILANRIVGITAVVFSVVGVALTTLR